jgi:hypothetical protein
LEPSFRTWQEIPITQQANVSNGLSGSAKELDEGIMFERPPNIGQVSEADIDECCAA